MADIDCTTVPIPDFHDIVFPSYISLGARVSVRYKTQVIRMRSGREERIGEWQDALREFDITPALRDQADLNDVLAFFQARSGPKYGFKLLDPTDYSVSNQYVGTGNDAQTQFSLAKFYTTNLEGETHITVRPIVCPDANIQIYFNGVLQTSGYTVNTTMGLLTFITPPASGITITWTGTFYVPVRFVDTRMAVSVEAYQSYDWRVRLMEIRTPISPCMLQETLNEDFVEVQLPLNFSRESTFGPEFATIVIDTDSGQTNRISQFIEGLQRFKIENPVKPITEMDELLHFFHARRGRLIGFRFQDYLANSVVNETFAVANGVLTEFQLLRTFTSGSVGRVKTIFKPVDSIIVYVNGVESVTAIVDYTIGTVTFPSPPADAAILSWTGSYDIPVRFDTDILTMQINGIDAMGWDTIELTEYVIGDGPLIDIPGAEIPEGGNLTWTENWDYEFP